MPVKRFFHQLLLYAALLTVLPVCVLILLKYQTMRIVEKLCTDNYIFLLDKAAGEMNERIRALEVMKYAIIVFGSLPVLLLYPFVQKYFVKGVMIGSLKG